VDQQRLLNALLNGDAADNAVAEPSGDSTGASRESSAEQAPGPAHLPNGSVHLSLDLPVSADLFDRGVPALARPAQPAFDQSGEAGPERPNESPEQQLLQSLFQMAAEGLQESSSGGLQQAPPADAEQDLNAETAVSLAPPAELDTRVTAASVPRDPLLQLRWWSHFDRALRRRLRNLSHAVNVEMLRVGLAQGLLPMNLLDAVLDGQVEALPAPANLLRLPLPMGQVLGAGAPTEVLTLLLRSADLEYEQPKLRTCRKRLEQRRRALRTMAKRYRSWQRRLSALEAEHQWFQDHAQHPATPAADQG
jgi:hypothetical protein